MSDKKMMIAIASYLAVFAVSSGIPIFLYSRGKLARLWSVIISIPISVVLINVYFFLVSRYDLASPDVLHELHEVFWLIPPVFVLCACAFIRRKDKVSGASRTI